MRFVAKERGPVVKAGASNACASFFDAPQKCINHRLVE
jgi:hypothetical protein